LELRISISTDYQLVERKSFSVKLYFCTFILIDFKSVLYENGANAFLLSASSYFWVDGGFVDNGLHRV
jgi:hypothetical protein